MIDRESSLRGLRERLDEVADVDWRHPAWWAFLLSVAALEALGRRRGGADPAAEEAGELHAAYLSVDGDERSDTFMARDGAAVDPTVEGAIARAVARAYAAASALARIDGELPGQPVRQAIERRNGWLVRRPLPSGPPNAVFLTASGAYLARLDDGAEVRLARSLGRVCAGGSPAELHRVDADDRAAVPAAIAVRIASEPIAVARHLHRGAWSAGGGPWLGVGGASTDSGPIDLVTTCHLAVDGYGHARIAASIFRALDRPAHPSLAALAAAARDGLGGTVIPFGVGSTPTGTGSPDRIGFAGERIAAPAPDFPTAAWAFGRVLDRTFREGPDRRRARHTPTFQVPIAPGGGGDDVRRRRRVVFGLLSIPMRDGETVSLDEFRAGLRARIARDAAGHGVLSRLGSAVVRGPFPHGLRRRVWTAGTTPNRLLPMVEVLRGRGSLSVVRFPGGDAPPPPLYAVSSPGLYPSRHDPRGGVVLTLMHHAHGATATVAGTGRLAQPAAARAFLDRWREEIDVVARRTSRGPSRFADRAARGAAG